MSNNTTKLVVLESDDLQEVEPSKAKQIKKVFEPMVKMLEDFESAYNDVVTEADNNGINEELTERARNIRLAIKKIRTRADKVRKREKEEYLRAGRAIQGTYNILKYAVTDREEKLLEIEKHFELQEQRRIEKLQKERLEELSKYVEDADNANLGEMSEDVWEAYIGKKRQDYEDRMEAERIAQEKRLEQERKESLLRDRERQVRELGNFFDYDSLTTETSEKAFNKLVKEAEKAKAAEEKRQAQIQKETEQRAKELEKERKERERIEAELKAKEEEERKKKEEEEARRQSELAKGDAEKLEDLTADLLALKTKYEFEAAVNKKLYKGVNSLVDKVVKYIEQNSKKG